MAETTATTALFRDASARIFATRLMQAASPTDVPPNFITCKGLFIFSRIRRNSIGKWLENRPSASKGASKNYTLLQRFCVIPSLRLGYALFRSQTCKDEAIRGAVVHAIHAGSDCWSLSERVISLRT